MGNKFIIRTLYANVITTSEVLIVLYGGLLLGVGVGLVFKVGGAIDGTEIYVDQIQLKMEK